MGRSNITIASNIYNRTSSNVKNDPGFVEKVRGRAALNILKDQLFGLANHAHLSKAQEMERQEGASCPSFLNKNQEKTFGPIFADGQIRWACRCENTYCHRFYTCMAFGSYAKKIERDLSKTVASDNQTDPPPLSFTRLGIDVETIFKTIEELSNSFPEVSEVLTSEEATTRSNIYEGDHSFIEISDPAIIIESPLNTKILVNAGPGTGKTYTAIRRLEYILQNRLADPSAILVLCYTNAAKKEIEDRIKTGVSKSELPFEANSLIVYTFDSLASYYLLNAGENMDGMDYNQRIELFNKKISPEPFSEFEYLIIDEIQDLVNQRAAMTLNILENINCSYLLLGDKCQAIYDYDCSENEEQTINSVEFYKRLDKLLPSDSNRYELTGNKRQSPALMRITDDMRSAILYRKPNEANELINNEILHFDSSPKYAEEIKPEQFSGKKTAILCRNNGEAEWLSANLRRRGIPHTLLRGSGQNLSLSRWIGDVFWDFCEPIIKQETFMKRYLLRVRNDEEQANKAFEVLAQVCGYEGKSDYLKMEDVVKGLKNGIRLPTELLNSIVDDLVVSTIHKAKGREYDKVYLLYSCMDVKKKNTEEARVWYVGATRPRSGLELLIKRSPSRWYFRRNPRGRSFRTMLGKGMFCSDLAIGLPDDVDDISSVDLTLGDPIDLQAYIAEHVQVNDPIECIRSSDDVYLILHKGRQIGKLSADISTDFRSAINMTNNKKSIPPRLYNLYISNIVTMVQRRFSERVPVRFRESRFWLGIEIAGFAKIDWHYGEENAV